MKSKRTTDQAKTADVFARITRDRVLRQHMAAESHHMFVAMYLSEYLKHPMAQFQKDMIHLTEDDSQELVCIAGFRNCGKTTLVTQSYPLWAILGVQQKKFVLIIAQTRDKARNYMANIRHILEQNRLLKSDMGPFREESGSGEWAISSLVFRNTGARIMIASVDQSVRGVRHREHRPDVIILDDVEDTQSVRTFEGRKKIADWYSREVVPLGDTGTRIFVLANVLHYDSLIMRLKRKIEDKEMDGTHRFFPILDQHGKPLWPEKFDSQKKINTLRRKLADEVAWQQEFMLQIASDSSQAIDPGWIQYYDEIPKLTSKTSERKFAAVDLAITAKESGDFTAIVTATVWYGPDGKCRIYIHPNPINKRMQFPDTIANLKLVINSLGKQGKLFIETTGFQEAYLQQLIQDGYHSVEGIKPLVDKQLRLTVVGPFVKDAIVLFPRQGCDQLIAQITNPSAERNDDLADAFSMLIHQIMENHAHVSRLDCPVTTEGGIFHFDNWKQRKIRPGMVW